MRRVTEPESSRWPRCEHRVQTTKAGHSDLFSSSPENLSNQVLSAMPPCWRIESSRDREIAMRSDATSRSTRTLHPDFVRPSCPAHGHL